MIWPMRLSAVSRSITRTYSDRRISAMKPTIKKVKDIRGRKILGYRAVFGPVESERHATPAAAIAECEQLTREALARLQQGATIATWRGHRLVITPSVYAPGWSYWIDTFSHGFTNGANYADNIEAYNAAVYHLAQGDWTLDADDHEILAAIPDKAKRADLASWIAFQRTYAQIKAAGEITADADIHRAACESSHVYAREHFAAVLHQAR